MDGKRFVLRSDTAPVESGTLGELRLRQSRMKKLQLDETAFNQISTQKVKDKKKNIRIQRSITFVVNLPNGHFSLFFPFV